MSKEKNDSLITKWGFMLDALDDSKASQSTYAKMFEATVMHTNSSTIKLVLPALQRILKAIPEMKFSPSPKNQVTVATMDRELIIDGWTIMPDGAGVLLTNVVKNVIQKFESGDVIRLGYIRLLETRGTIQIDLYY